MNIYYKYNKHKYELEDRVRHIAGIYGGLVSKMDHAGVCDWDDLAYNNVDKLDLSPVYESLKATLTYYVAYEDYHYDFTVLIPFSLLEATDEDIEKYYTQYVTEQLSKHYEDKLRGAIFTLKEMNNLNVDVVMLAKEARSGAKPIGVLLKEYAISVGQNDD